MLTFYLVIGVLLLVFVVLMLPDFIAAKKIELEKKEKEREKEKQQNQQTNNQPA